MRVRDLTEPVPFFRAGFSVCPDYSVFFKLTSLSNLLRYISLREFVRIPVYIRDVRSIFLKSRPTTREIK